MTRTVRLAIFGSSPCERCVAACCKQNGHAYAVLLRGDEERRRFAAWASDVAVRDEESDRPTFERVITYRDGRCPFLGDDDRCTIYEERPQSCRRFECVRFFNEHGLNQHGRFLELNPNVTAILRTM